MVLTFNGKASVKPALDVIKHFADMFKEDFHIQDRLRELINAKNAPLNNFENALKKAYPLVFPEPEISDEHPLAEFEYLHHPKGWRPKHNNKGEFPL